MAVKNLERFGKLFDLSGRVAVVTGGARGNGLGIANALAEAGAEVVAADLKFPEESPEKLLPGIHQRTINVTDEAGTQTVFAGLAEEFGHIDILVNNAGICFARHEIDQLDLDEFRAVLDVNLTGTVICTKSVVPFMKAKGWGRIVNISSSQAFLRTNGASAYAASKTAISHLTRIWGQELAPYGIIVNALCPSYVLTPMMENSITTRAQTMGLDREEMRRVYTEEIPLKRFIEVEEVANWVVLLCGALSLSITANNIAITGGQVQL